MTKAVEVNKATIAANAKMGFFTVLTPMRSILQQTHILVASAISGNLGTWLYPAKQAGTKHCTAQQWQKGSNSEKNSRSNGDGLLRSFQDYLPGLYRTFLDRCKQGMLLRVLQRSQECQFVIDRLPFRVAILAPDPNLPEERSANAGTLRRR